MNIIDIIEKKKHKKALSEAEIAYFIEGICAGTIPDYQASALLMAICLCGMDARETAILTDKMAHSGKVLDLSALAPCADKHSTGGVGDKTSLVVAPIAAACGIHIAKMSGRGLGHTGGTIDKLESIPGFRTALSEKEFFEQVQRIGIALVAQSESLDPADKILYALRDVTGTVDSLPLIASSIMSKKLAAGAQVIELDVKTGDGAFMKTPEQAKALAQAMVDIGKANGKKTAALITDMDTPLGRCIGNSLEIIEVIALLRGEGDADLRELCLALAAGIISLAKGCPKAEAAALAAAALESGAAFEKLKEMVVAQGGDVRYIEQPERFERAAYSLTLTAPESGYLCALEAAQIGKAAATLGAGRQKKSDSIDMSAGIVLHASVGDKLDKGDAFATLYTNTQSTLAAAAEQVMAALQLSTAAPAPRGRILGEIQ